MFTELRTWPPEACQVLQQSSLRGMMHGELLEMIDVHGFEALDSNGAWEFQWIFQWVYNIYNIHMVIVHPFSAGIGRDSYWRSYGIQFQWFFEWIPMDWNTKYFNNSFVAPMDSDDPPEAAHGFHGAHQLHKGTHNEYHFNLFIRTDAKKTYKNIHIYVHIYIYDIHIYLHPTHQVAIYYPDFKPSHHLREEAASICLTSFSYWFCIQTAWQAAAQICSACASKWGETEMKRR